MFNPSYTPVLSPHFSPSCCGDWKETESRHIHRPDGSYKDAKEKKKIKDELKKKGKLIEYDSKLRRVYGRYFRGGETIHKNYFLSVTIFNGSTKTGNKQNVRGIYG